MKEIVTLECGHPFFKTKLQAEWRYLEDLGNQGRTNQIRSLIACPKCKMSVSMLHLAGVFKFSNLERASKDQ